MSRATPASCGGRPTFERPRGRLPYPSRSLMIGNGGNKPAKAEFTILYNQGSEQYQVEQMLAPDEQMLVDFGKLIRNQILDKNGHVLPPDLTSGAYRIRDLEHNPLGALYEGKVIVDKTYGHAAYGCGVCCGPDAPLMAFDPLGVGIDDYADQYVQALDSCGGGVQDFTGDFSTWWTDDTAIATANKNSIHGVAAGTTNHYAQSDPMYWGVEKAFNSCPISRPQTTAGTKVTAVPVNFHLISAEPANDNVTPSLEADFAWQSSDGKVADIAGCFIKEHVTFPNTNNGTCPSSAQNCFFPASPPWAAKGAAGSGFANPTDTAPGINAQVEAQHDLDSVGNLAFVNPYSASPFSGTQIFQYSCNGGSWVTLYGPVTINYSMAKNAAGKWQVVVSRSDTPVTSVYLIPNQ